MRTDPVCPRCGNPVSHKRQKRWNLDALPDGSFAHVICSGAREVYQAEIHQAQREQRDGTVASWSVGDVSGRRTTR